MPEPIQRRKLYQEVLERLMARIHRGEFPPGSQLPSERDLMDQYAVGRPAVREALQAMERSGFVEIAHGERARVLELTADRLIAQIGAGAQHLLRTKPDMLKHMKQARVFLETSTARMAAECATEEQIERLRQTIAAHRASMVTLEEFIERDMAFHREIADISGNPIFPAVVESMFRWASEFYTTLVRAPGAEELTLAEHQRIVDAIAAHDGDAAAEAMHAHLMRANQLYRELGQP
ncbi:GntR family transcriptional regulator [Herbaspirillum rubrisubalbicans]|uniref:GntR family transcriptional regulator n=2 Tax=Herbaspirillum rubrisubalbicans TaxID=80842 RepID=A0ABX9BWX1_9BURK|nr:transcriptional regulator NanR [Herbaspirillum rubrisubalbicans]MCP1576722.1 DNA-binding FadR family transcriptional regulator [Herbaspirillum rubrisubalbicans]QJP99956.1 GntR family transcriptional regulator [Herbaspirillum rubrisubalbicans Os34]RAM62366.1 GntR family transcriptional regulator [Herbaspirillum rubrisubalbicans]RAN49610.1 GntR family transcriptional regulator [Herbaspirillum rubrisubalbicans]